MSGMAEVGRLFNDNQLIVAEVLQSAEAMKAAVSHLEQFMEKSETSSKGRILLATVKGDVHDIGKNLVDIVLSNNGYEVINLGIKIPPEALIEACREHSPDIIGLSGLLVKSAQMMVLTAEDMTKSGSTPPMLVGGAALSEKFTLTRIAPAYAGSVHYAKDAMSGLALADRIRAGGDGLKELEEAAAKVREREGAKTEAGKASSNGHDPGDARSRSIDLVTAPKPPDLVRHVETEPDLSQLWEWINPQALYGRHLGLKGKWETLLEKGDPKAVELRDFVRGVMDEAETGRMKARAVWQWFPAEADGNLLRLRGIDGAVREEIPFRRQRVEDGLAVPDWVRPAGDGPDWIGMFVTTMGEGIRAWAEDLKTKGEYLKMHVVQALALEGAEAYAEWLHARMRTDWDIGDPPGTTMPDRFRGKYRGVRVSFGYPACPDLEHQEILWRLLKPEEIGVELTDGYMMDPEASVSALVFHHPQGRYFSLGAEQLAELSE
jgi:5-methyltetrahydrofolate--homocysteine methyltransferase